ncbi:MAG: hypothetical protein Q4P20_00145 [Eubacteriales bacterium]|nr:hypothetical protein [Eubacteriales bacterium]
MEIRRMDCKGCSNGCPLTVTVEQQEVVDVTGNCCHRGIASAKAQLKSVQQQWQQPGRYSGRRNIFCSGCSNRCLLTVTVLDGVVHSLTGEGCRRGIISARKQLEK